MAGGVIDMWQGGGGSLTCGRGGGSLTCGRGDIDMWQEGH